MKKAQHISGGNRKCAIASFPRIKNSHFLSRRSDVAARRGGRLKAGSEFLRHFAELYCTPMLVAELELQSHPLRCVETETATQTLHPPTTWHGTSDRPGAASDAHISQASLQVIKHGSIKVLVIYVVKASVRPVACSVL